MIFHVKKENAQNVIRGTKKKKKKILVILQVFRYIGICTQHNHMCCVYDVLSSLVTIIIIILSILSHYNW